MKHIRGTIIILAFLFNPGFPSKISEFIAYMRKVLDAMAGNADYPTPDPTLADVGDAIDDLEENEQKFKNGEITKEVRDGFNNNAREISTNLIRYAEYKAAGNTEKGSTSKINMRKTPSARPTPDKPTILSLVAPIAGRATLKWSKSEFASTYLLRISKDNGQTWQIIDAIEKLSYTVYNLDSMTRYVFQVMARNPKGDSGWSQPAVVVTQ